VKNLRAGFQLFLLAALAALAAGCSGSTSSPAAAPTGNPSREAKEVKLDFSLLTPAGESVELGKLDGSIRVVDFWATWCPPCREEIPHFNELHRKYKDKGVNFVGISVDENPKVLAAFDKEIHIEYASLLTSQKAEEAFGGVAGLPSTFVLDRQGRVVKSYVGEVDAETLEGDIQKLLAVR
jgi:thiol-disulfide isomerase/thioredoxin